jgi:hypothetical protein
MRFVYKGVPLGTRREGGSLLLGGPSTSFQLHPLYEYFSASYIAVTQTRTERNFHMRTRGYHVLAGLELRELWSGANGAQTFRWTLP